MVRGGAHVCAFISTLSLLISIQVLAAEPLPEPVPTPTAIPSEIKLRNTYYYVVLESEYAGQTKDAKILNMKGETIAEVSRAFKRAVTVEGTGRLDDGRVINFAGRVDGEIRYLVTKAPYGLGVGSCKLRPFGSAAVDPSVIPLGSTIRIKETEGMRLPGGRRHDGLWHASDIGGAIKSDRVDLFVGDGDQGEILRQAGITNLMPLTAEIVELPKEDSCVGGTPELFTKAFNGPNTNLNHEAAEEFGLGNYPHNLLPDGQ